MSRCCAEIFPGRAVEAALVWTDGPKLMPIPEKMVRRNPGRVGRRLIREAALCSDR